MLVLLAAGFAIMLIAAGTDSHSLFLECLQVDDVVA